MKPVNDFDEKEDIERILGYDSTVQEASVRSTPADDISGGNGEDESILQEADRIVSTTRGEAYGHPLDDFSRVAFAAGALGINPSGNPLHHALYMILVKLSREVNKHNRDNLVDISGYAKTQQMVHDKLKEING